MCKLIFHSQIFKLLIISLLLPWTLGFSATGDGDNRVNDENIKSLKTKVLIKSQEAKISKQREIEAKKALEELEQEKEGESAEKMKNQNNFNSNRQSVNNGRFPGQKSELTEQYQLQRKRLQQVLHHKINPFSEAAISSEGNQFLAEAIAETLTKPTAVNSLNDMMNNQSVLSSSMNYFHDLSINKSSLSEIEKISNTEDVLNPLNEKLIDNGIEAESLSLKIKQAESGLSELRQIADELNQVIDQKEALVGQLVNEKEVVEQKSKISDLERTKAQLKYAIKVVQQEREKNKAQFVNYQEKLEQEIQAGALLNSEYDRLKADLNKRNQEFIAKEQELKNMKIKNDELAAQVQESRQIKDNIESLEQEAPWYQDLHGSDNELPRHMGNNASLNDKLPELENNHLPMAFGVNDQSLVDTMVTTLKMDNEKLKAEKTAQNVKFEEKVTELKELIDKYSENQEKLISVNDQNHQLLGALESWKVKFNALQQSYLLLKEDNIKLKADRDQDNEQLNWDLLRLDSQKKEIQKNSEKQEILIKELQEAKEKIIALEEERKDHGLYNEKLSASHKEEISRLKEQYEAYILKYSEGESLWKGYTEMNLNEKKSLFEEYQEYVRKNEDIVNKLTQTEGVLLLQKEEDRENIKNMKAYIEDMRPLIDQKIGLETNEIYYQEKIKQLEQDMATKKALYDKIAEEVTDYINREDQKVEQLQKQILADKETIEKLTKDKDNNLLEVVNQLEQREQDAKVKAFVKSSHIRSNSLISNDSTAFSISSEMEQSLNDFKDFSISRESNFELKSEKLKELERAGNKPTPQKKLTASASSLRSSSTDSRRSYTVISARKQKADTVPEFNTVKINPSLYNNGKQTQRYISDNKSVDFYIKH